MSISLNPVYGPVPSSARFGSAFLLFKGMVLDGRGPDRGWQEDGSGMSMIRFTATVVALTTL